MQNQDSKIEAKKNKKSALLFVKYAMSMLKNPNSAHDVDYVVVAKGLQHYGKQNIVN